MDTQIKHVAIYVRKSRKEETEDTINRQQEVLISFCERNSWDWKLYKEIGSSQNLDRPQLQALLSQVKLFAYDAIVVADQDRLSRNIGHFAQIKEVLINYGCLVATPSKIYNFQQDDDDLFSDINSVMAKTEYRNARKRLIRGTRQSAKDGNWVGKKAPVGYLYNKETKRLVQSQDAPIIRHIFELYLSGKSTKDISFLFNHTHVMTSKGTVWSPSGISQIINNPVYAGHSVYGKTAKVNGKRGVKTPEKDWVVVKHTHKPVVSEEEWDKVCSIRKNRNSRPVPLKVGKHKFSGLIHCKLCGRVLSFQTAHGKLRITSCQTRHYTDPDHYTVCQNEGCNVEDFEKLFYSSFRKYAKKLKDYADKVKQAELSKSRTYTDDISKKETELGRLEADIKRVQRGFIMEIFTEEEAHNQIQGLKSQIESLRQDISKLEKEESYSLVDALEERMNHLSSFFNNNSGLGETEQNDILREFIDTILYSKVDGHMTIKVHYR